MSSLLLKGRWEIVKIGLRGGRGKLLPNTVNLF